MRLQEILPAEPHHLVPCVWADDPEHGDLRVRKVNAPVIEIERERAAWEEVETRINIIVYCTLTKL